MKIRAFIVICLLIVSLIPGSGCIDSSSEPVKETGLEEITDNQDSLFNDTVAPAPAENFSEKSNNLELEKQSSFSRYYSKEKLQFEVDVPAYSLPLKASEIANYDDFMVLFFLTLSQAL